MHDLCHNIGLAIPVLKLVYTTLHISECLFIHPNILLFQFAYCYIILLLRTFRALKWPGENIKI